MHRRAHVQDEPGCSVAGVPQGWFGGVCVSDLWGFVPPMEQEPGLEGGEESMVQEVQDVSKVEEETVPERGGR